MNSHVIYLLRCIQQIPIYLRVNAVFSHLFPHLDCKSNMKLLFIFSKRLWMELFLTDRILLIPIRGILYFMELNESLRRSSSLLLVLVFALFCHIIRYHVFFGNTIRLQWIYIDTDVISHWRAPDLIIIWFFYLIKSPIVSLSWKL